MDLCVDIILDDIQGFVYLITRKKNNKTKQKGNNQEENLIEYKGKVVAPTSWLLEVPRRPSDDTLV